MSQTIDANHQSRSIQTLQLLRPYAGWLGLVVGLLFLLTFVDMAAPYFLKLLVDDVFPQTPNDHHLRLLWLILPGMVLSYMARNILFYTTRMRSLRISEDLCFDLRKRLFEHLQRLNLSFYRTHQPGRLSARLMDDTFKIQSFIQDKLPTLIRYLLEFQILLILIYVMNWRLAIASTIVLPLHLATSHYFRGSIRKSHSEAQESLAQAHGNIVEKFLGMEVVKGFGAEERESHSFRKAIDASRRNQIRSQRFLFSQKVVADLLVGLGTVVLLAYGTYNVVSGRMKSGEFLMFFLYVKMLYPAVLSIISGVGHLSKATASVDRVFEMLAEPAAQHSQSGTWSANLAGHIEYRQVSFCYDAEAAPVLHDLNIIIEPGDHVALTGPSGAGKSTLISLLPRFNDPTSGHVLIDGRPADAIDLKTLRELFGMVFQEVFLFNTSIYENLRYARPQATLDDIKEACKITGAHDFIKRLPDGYYSCIGAGSELSRGERQRITLARALVKNPQVLIIDEATASIDAPAAREITQSILRLMKGRTVIMVTHDIKLLDLVDRVITIEKGHIVYDGEPQRLHRVPPTTAAPDRELPHRQRPVKPTRSPTIRRTSGPMTGLVGLVLLWMLHITPLIQAQDTQPTPTPKPTASVNEPSAAPAQPAKPTKTKVQPKTQAAKPAPAPSAAKAKTQPAPTTKTPPPAQPKTTPTKPNNQAKAPAKPKAQPQPKIKPEPKAPPKPQKPKAQPKALPAPQTKSKVEVSVQTPLPKPTGPVTRILPSHASRLISLPKLSQSEMQDVSAGLELHLDTQFGYVHTDSNSLEHLPTPPLGLVESRLLTRPTSAGTLLLRFGIRPFVSQPPELWVMGLTISKQGTWSANGDLDGVEPDVKQMLTSMDHMRKNLTVRDLDTKIIQLSYTDAKTALAMLKGMGITTMNQPTEIPDNVDFSKLPYVAMVPDPDKGDTGLIGSKSNTRGEFGLSLTPGVASDMTPNTIASPMTRLMVMFHPAHPEQFSEVRRLLDDYVDKPARQIFIEGMVLEISEQGLKELGVKWQLNPTSPISIKTDGTLNAGGDEDTLTIMTPDTSALNQLFEGKFQWDWSTTIRALVQEGKAQILSRPSVLTLNNRQSTIRVGRDIPIAQSYEGAYNSSNKVAFSFKYLPTGILLNIRPRINEAGTEVSMLIDTIVSAQVPGNDLELKSSDGQVLAKAPTVSTRRVQTYGRIRNNTPFIIGGLVSREMTQTQDKVPLLGDLPLIGFLFRAQKNESTKTEVIIVVTPYILPDKKIIPRSLPKDEDLFDSFGNKLFRDSYRIRTADVFDLSFLLKDPRIVHSRQEARATVAKDFRLGTTEPYRSFVKDSIPGESILVSRMIYDVIKRLHLTDHVNDKRIIYMESRQVGGYNVDFLNRLLEKKAGGKFKSFDHQALALTFTGNPDANDSNTVDPEAIPTITMVDCPDRTAWGKTLWKLNQPLADGQKRQTVLIKDASDVKRLCRALTLKKIIVLNGGQEQMRLRNFSVGKVLLMPELKQDQINVLDADTARLFFYTEHYYGATLAKIETKIKALNKVLKD